MCPIHGRFAHYTVLIFAVLFIYGALWSVTGKDALPGGNIFAISMIFMCCSVAGVLVGKIRLPPLLGNYAVEVIVTVAKCT